MFTIFDYNNVNNNNMSATKVISIRLPEAMVNEIKTVAKSKGTTTSQMFRDRFTDINQLDAFKSGGEVEVNSEIAETLTAVGGGSAMGLMVYKLVNSGLEDLEEGNAWKEKKELVSTIAGIASALLTGYGLMKSMKTLK